MQTVFQHESVAVFFVILLTKQFRFCVQTISGTKLNLPPLFDRHLLMNSHRVHLFYVSLNQNSGNSYGADLIFLIFVQSGLLEKLKLMEFQHSICLGFPDT